MARWARFLAVALVVRGRVVVKVVGEVDEAIKLAKALSNQAGIIMVVAKVEERLNLAKVDLVVAVAEADSAT